MNKVRPFDDLHDKFERFFERTLEIKEFLFNLFIAGNQKLSIFMW